jgi:hypothetical protein
MNCVEMGVRMIEPCPAWSLACIDNGDMSQGRDGTFSKDGDGHLVVGFQATAHDLHTRTILHIEPTARPSCHFAGVSSQADPRASWALAMAGRGASRRRTTRFLQIRIRPSLRQPVHEQPLEASGERAHPARGAREGFKCTQNSLRRERARDPPRNDPRAYISARRGGECCQS